MSESPSPHVCAEYLRDRQKLDKIALERGKAAIIASQAIWMEEGEKSSKYFLRQAQTRAAQRTITALQKDNGNIIQGNKNILEECAKYYEKLYSSYRFEKERFEQFAPSDNVPRLSEADKSVCEGPMTTEEGKYALSKMARNKASGVSGFSAEFFSFFWDDIGNIIIEYANEAREKGELFIAHRRGVLTLIPKKNNQKKLENKRPICLLDVLYKLLAKIISIRIESVE